jgi:hypothetical protein
VIYQEPFSRILNEMHLQASSWLLLRQSHHLTDDLGITALTLIFATTPHQMIQTLPPPFKNIPHHKQLLPTSRLLPCSSPVLGQWLIFQSFLLVGFQSWLLIPPMDYANLAKWPGNDDDAPMGCHHFHGRAALTSCSHSPLICQELAAVLAPNNKKKALLVPSSQQQQAEQSNNKTTKWAAAAKSRFSSNYR